MRRLIKILFNFILFVIVGVILVFGLPTLIAEVSAHPRLYTLETVPARRVAVVFGAGLQRDGTPSPVLRDRVEKAAELYFAGKVEKLLMSGDNRFVDYNEPASMQAYAVRLGVPVEDIVLDFAGRRTYDTCYRAREIFQVDETILVTQRYHLTRALFTCNNLSLDAIGVPADNRNFRRSTRAFWQIREYAATAVALWEVWISRPLPVLGEPEPIFRDETVNYKSIANTSY